MTHLAWVGGGEATLLEAGADKLVLRSDTPAPPGARVEGTVENGTLVRLKVHSCKRQPDGSFVLQGRPLDLTRGMRELLARLVKSGEAR